MQAIATACPRLQELDIENVIEFSEAGSDGAVETAEEAQSAETTAEAQLPPSDTNLASGTPTTASPTASYRPTYCPYEVLAKIASIRSHLRHFQYYTAKQGPYVLSRDFAEKSSKQAFEDFYNKEWKEDERNVLEYVVIEGWKWKKMTNGKWESSKT